jgi:hypothetical protein
MEAIFRRLIEDEVRAGRCDRRRRARLVRYAAQLRLNAVDAGLMIEDCRRRMAAESAPHAAPPSHGASARSGSCGVDSSAAFLRLCPPPSTRRSERWVITTLIVGALIADAVLIGWFIL